MFQLTKSYLYFQEFKIHSLQFTVYNLQFTILKSIQVQNQMKIIS